MTPVSPSLDTPICGPWNTKTAPSTGTWWANALIPVETCEGEAVESAQLEWPKHFIGTLGIFDDVQVVAANAVREHDLARLDPQAPLHQIQERVHRVARTERVWITAPDNVERRFGGRSYSIGPSQLRVIEVVDRQWLDDGEVR